MKALNISPNKRYYIDSNGCEKRKLDAERIIQYMDANGFERVENDIEAAGVVIFVSCAFNNENEKRSVEALANIKRRAHEGTRIILVGCLPAIKPRYPSDNGIEFVVGTRDLERFDEIISGPIKMASIPDQNVSVFDNRPYPKPDMDFRSSILEEYVSAKNEYKIRVGWGCLSNCSYCSIKNATGALRSKLLNDILSEIQRGIGLGKRTFFFTGDDTGAYGLDIGINVMDLVRTITSVNDIKIIFQEFNMQWLIKYKDEFASLLRERMNQYRKFTLVAPMQSGSNRILKLMNRPYNVEDAIDAIHAIRYKNPKVYVGTHFIVGFPGETDSDFEQTQSMVRACDFDLIFPFTYTDNSTTKAFKFPNKVCDVTAFERRDLLLKMQKTLDIKANRYLNSDAYKIPRLHDLGHKIEGWLTDKEGELLHDLARNVALGATRGGAGGEVVEIGSWKGKSAFYLASGLIDGGSNGILHAIDHHKGSKEQQDRSEVPVDTLGEFFGNMRAFHLGAVLKVHVMDSLLASRVVQCEPRLIFIDGSHEYEDVKADFNAWWPKLSIHGILAFHDTISKPSVSRLVDEIVRKQNDIRNMKLVDEIVCLEKTPAGVKLGEHRRAKFLEQKEIHYSAIVELKARLAATKTMDESKAAKTEKYAAARTGDQ
jgi:threonylcarbamoyladenosine tRNA methylthiotransferase MtaB